MGLRTTLERPQGRSQVPDEQAKEDAAPEELVLISARVRKSTRRKARVFCAEQDVSMQDLIDRALNEYIDRHGT
jgi:hypothetical protein